jgi:hypothetical protein
VIVISPLAEFLAVLTTVNFARGNGSFTGANPRLIRQIPHGPGSDAGVGADAEAAVVTKPEQPTSAFPALVKEANLDLVLGLDAGLYNADAGTSGPRIPGWMSETHWSACRVSLFQNFANVPLRRGC